EDGIRDRTVTGVQTCALPIWRSIFEAENGNELNTWSFGLDAKFPWGKIRDRASYETALLDLQQAEIRLKQTRTKVQADVRDILRSEERRVGKEGRSRWWR